jgi:hypothetical protein
MSETETRLASNAEDSAKFRPEIEVANEGSASSPHKN